MTDITDLPFSARPAPTPLQAWRSKQRRISVTLLVVGLALLVGGLGWMTRSERNPDLGVLAVVAGFALLLASSWFGLRAAVGEPREE